MSSEFRSLHPLPCFLYYISVTILAMLLLHPVFLTASLLLLGILNVMVEERKAALVRTMVSLIVIGMAFTMLNPLFSRRGEHILFYVWDLPITGESVWYGLTLSLSILSILFAFISYRHVITNDKFLFLFSSIWPRGTLITVMAMRFVPLLQARLKAIAAMQRSKGLSMRRGSLRTRAENGMKMLQILLTWSMEEALQTADSMKSRGYGLGPRSAYSAFRMRPRDWRAVFFIGASFLLCVLGRVYGHGVMVIYPSLGTWRFSDMDWAVFGVFLCLTAWPLMMEGRGWAAWRFLR